MDNGKLVIFLRWGMCCNFTLIGSILPGNFLIFQKAKLKELVCFSEYLLVDAVSSPGRIWLINVVVIHTSNLFILLDTGVSPV